MAIAPIGAIAFCSLRYTHSSSRPFRYTFLMIGEGRMGNGERALARGAGCAGIAGGVSVEGHD